MTDRACLWMLAIAFVLDQVLWVIASRRAMYWRRRALEAEAQALDFATFASEALDRANRCH